MSDSPSMAERRPQMFPDLTPAQVARIGKVGKERRFSMGDVLVQQGDAETPMFVVLEGEVEVSSVEGDVLTQMFTQGPMQFTGEMDLVSGRRALVQVKALTEVRTLEVVPRALGGLVQSDSELSELFMRAFILRRMGLLDRHAGDAVVVGSRHSSSTLRVQEFLTRNGHPYRYVDADADDSVQGLFDTFHISIDDVPVLICRGDKVLKNPTNREIADCLGFNASISGDTLRDLVVIGAGPAGLAAAVYGASEGLDVLVIEATAPGGQAGSSSKIENYLGFPTGISGQALASRALIQAEKFGANIAIARSAVHLHCAELPYRVELESGTLIAAKSIVLASGAQYAKLELPDLARFEGVGIYYAASFVEEQRCEGDEVIVVGGANSAGQAATYLARSCRHVHMMIRGAGLAATMSRYLTRRIEDTANITLHTHTQVTALEGKDSLEQVTWKNDQTGETTKRPIRHVFSMTGAKPNTDWLNGCIALDDKGFIRTGPDLQPEDLARFGGGRPPYLFETSLPRVFSVGDVRSSSVKRVASAVGEGSICVQLVHKVLAE